MAGLSYPLCALLVGVIAATITTINPASAQSLLQSTGAASDSITPVILEPLPANSAQLQSTSVPSQASTPPTPPAPPTTPTLPPPPPALVHFYGMQHGFANDSAAAAALERSLSALTKQPIRVDAIQRVGRAEAAAAQQVRTNGDLWPQAMPDEVINELSENAASVSGSPQVDVSWHSLKLTGCDLNSMNELLATIKSPTSGAYTREFKMFVGEEFQYPQRVEVEWQGECENVARKRNQLPGEEAAPKTGEQAAAGPSPSNPSAATTTSEPVAPSTTTPSSPITVLPEADQTEASTEPDVTSASPNAISTEDSLFSGWGSFNSSGGLSIVPVSSTFMDNTSLLDFNNEAPISLVSNLSSNKDTQLVDQISVSTLPLDESSKSLRNLSSAEETATTTTTTSNKTANIDEQSETNATITTTTTTTTTPEPTTAPTTTTNAMTLTETTTTITTTTTTTTAPVVGNIEERATSAQAPELQAAPANSAAAPTANSGPHYGKYVGFTIGFLVVAAYLLCVRAYNRQGMYDLVSSESPHRSVA